MDAITNRLDVAFAAIPLPLLEAWGRFGYLVGLALAICAFGRFTFRLGAGWGFGQERQLWDGNAVLSIAVTFVLVLVTGYVGSFIVLVPGAQTLESLKDLIVFLCIVLFGYPALITVPFAYGLSDLLEGVPPDSLLDWLPGYFINPACFWVGYQLLGKRPDFRRLSTWARYLVFVAIFLGIEPVLWGFVCSDRFTPAISYRTVTPALYFTTSVTWLLAPLAMLVALPLARRLGLFWAEIPGHVKERALGGKAWVWEAGPGDGGDGGERAGRGLPIRMFLLAPFIALVLVMVGVTAYVTLKSAEDDATRLAVRLHGEIAQNIDLQLDDYLERRPDTGDATRVADIEHLLRGLPVAVDGRAFIVARDGRVVASSEDARDPIVAGALIALRRMAGGLAAFGSDVDLHFDHVTAKPLSRERWLAHAARYRDRGGGHVDWILVTVMPEHYYLAGIRTGRSHSAMVFAVALVLSLAVAAALAAIMSAPLLRVSRAAQGMAGGALSQRVPVSPLDELGTLAQSFNDMAAQLERSFEALTAEVETRKRRERELETSEERLLASENRVQLAIKAAHLGVWDWDVGKDALLWDDSMYRLYGLGRDEFRGAYEAWTSCLVAEDRERALGDVTAALRGERGFASDFRVRWPDGSIHVLRGVAETVRGDDGQPVRMVGVNWDVTEELRVEAELRHHRVHLEELVGERTSALSVAVGQAEAANRAKSTFLANMSHEIRTPMNVILGYAQLLKQDASLGGAHRQKLEAIHASGSHLLTVINDVLEMSKIEAGRMTILAEPFTLRGLLDELQSMFAGLIDGRRIALSFELDAAFPAVVEGDAGKVRQVLINLLSNAAKFTSDGHIRVRGSHDRVGPERWRVVISVTDTGSGMAADDLPRIFNAFDQLEAGARIGGSGLGLAISRSFAQLMHGDLTVVSEVSKGSTFRFSFEVGAAREGSIAPDEGPMPVALGAEQARPRILVVDDVDVNRDILEEVLARIGFEVRVAVDGEHALSVHDAWRPALVLMDLRMPGPVDGLEAMRRLRAAGSTAVMVALTASGVAEAERSALAAGADAFLRKPYRVRELLDRIGDLLGVEYRYQASHQPARPAAVEPPLSTLLAELGPDLVQRLGTAAVEARAGQIRGIADEIAPHAAAAAVALRAVADRFDYDLLLDALAAGRPS